MWHVGENVRVWPTATPGAQVQTARACQEMGSSFSNKYTNCLYSAGTEKVLLLLGARPSSLMGA